MARIEMVRDFDWRVPGAKSATMIALKAGQSYTVKRACAESVVAAGAGVEIEAPGKTATDPCAPSPPVDL